MSESNQGDEGRRTLAQEWQESRIYEESSLRTHLAITQPPVMVREIAGLLLLVLVSDLTLYRSYGFAGPASFFLIAPILLCFGTVRIKSRASTWVLAAMLLTLSVRLLWCGSALAILASCVILCCFSLSLSGIPPYMTWTIAFAGRIVAAGLRGLKYYAHSLSRYNPAPIKTQWFAIGMPLFTLVTFGTIFVMANPDLVKSFGQNLAQFAELLERWISHFDLAEIVFCIAAAWIGAGFLRPDFHASVTDDLEFVEPEQKVKSPLYEGYRNALAVVIGLFAVYLIFEFQTLWFRSFPKGFHYSGYAHEGAAWLTVALGLATILLSLMFRGTILADPRFPQLRTLSWIWSAQNLLLAVAVFNRLFIYVGFNGMTRMRVIGVLGVTSVVVGFVLVLIKIAQNRDFTWLIRRQLWTVSIAAYLYAVFPVDAFVNQYNVSRILSGDPAPCVQISVHPTTDEGYLMLKPLIECSDQTIRDGVRGLLHDKLNELNQTTIADKTHGWTTTQLATQQLRARLSPLKTQLANDSSTERREAAITKFHEYAYQWY